MATPRPPAPPSRLFLSVFAIALSSAAPSFAEAPVPPDHAEKMTRGLEIFAKAVRPLLTDKCLRCHGGEKTRSGLDLTTREGLLRGGDKGLVVAPGQAKDSRLYRFIAHLDEPFMPPKEDRLSDDSVAQIAAWIDCGAPYDKPLIEKAVAKKPMKVTDEDRKYWAFLPLKRPPEPKVKDADAAWRRTPIDSFVLAKLEEKGLTPNGPADRRKLIRRAYLDLLGLPPTPEEVEVFVNDSDPAAYDKLIDRLLDNPHYGERWARHWLDLAHYADSHGYEQDYDRPNAYPYRDFVIKAFNMDLPFDTFVKWQIAGDEFAPDNPLALTATGFLGCRHTRHANHSKSGRKRALRRAGRHRADDRHDNARPDHRLRPLPRPQVRPYPDARLLPDDVHVHDDGALGHGRRFQSRGDQGGAGGVRRGAGEADRGAPRSTRRINFRRNSISG